MGDSESIRNHAAFIWSVADLLRGRLQAVRVRQGHPAAHGPPPPRLRARADQAGRSWSSHKQLAGRIENVEPVLQAVAGQQFYNTSPLTFTKLLDDPNTIADSLALYIGGFSEAAKDVIEKFDFDDPDRPARAGRTSSTR